VDMEVAVKEAADTVVAVKVAVDTVVAVMEAVEDMEVAVEAVVAVDIKVVAVDMAVEDIKTPTVALKHICIVLHAELLKIVTRAFIRFLASIRPTQL